MDGLLMDGLFHSLQSQQYPSLGLDLHRNVETEEILSVFVKQFPPPSDLYSGIHGFYGYVHIVHHHLTLCHWTVTF